MKTKFYWVALLASAALIAQAKAGGHIGGGGGGNFAAPSHAAAPTHVAGPTFHSAPVPGFSSGRFVPSGRISAIGMRASNSFHQPRIVSSDRAVFVGRRSSTTGRINHRGDRIGGNASRGSIAARDHVFARRTANWHRDWDRRRDHWWHGHRCHFVNGLWFIYDAGFYPYGYPYNYYAYDYYPYEYGPGVYEDSDGYYSQGAYDSVDQSAGSTVAAAQEQLARQGYYRGEIDGIFGPETRRAIARYQSNHGLRVTGYLTQDTVQALQLQPVASN